MIWADNAIAGLIIIYTISGFIRGYNQELFSLVVWIVVLAVGWCFSSDFAIFLTKVFATSSTRLVASFVSLALITLTLGWVINLLLSDNGKTTGLSIMERFGGILLGSFHGMIVAFVMVLIAGMTPLPKENWWHKSQFIPPMQTLATILRDNIPTKLAASINYR
ncbi:MAG: CvpA family protein [Methylococcaceae bacterium]|nr:CvpA family protein [Methylococcaceae bacterium]